MNINKSERIPSIEYSRKKIVDQIDDLRESLGVDSLEKTLEQIIEIFSLNSVDEEQVPFFQSKVAFLFERLMENWQKNGRTISDFKKEIDNFFESKNNLPYFFRHIRSEQLGKRQPDMIESIQGTLDRFARMEQLEVIFEKPCKGIIVGGSLSYGPFYNIRTRHGDNESSDIDAIFVLDPDSIDKDWGRFMHCSDFSESDKQKFIARKDIFFQSLLPNGEAAILSQKFPLKGADYEISTHFFTEETFDSMLNINIAEKIEGDNRVVVFKDYKSKPFPYNVCAQTNFEGTSYNYTVPVQRKIDEGVITELPAYIINNHKFYPGIYQNLILPAFSVFYDRNGEITNKISIFKNDIKTYIKNKYEEKDIEERILKSHIRNKIFPETLKEEMED
ncbi:MAG: hypothetical protein WC244_02040 [Patescibacteria group bacterium]|jgi:hypothetical protein